VNALKSDFQKNYKSKGKKINYSRYNPSTDSRKKRKDYSKIYFCLKIKF